MLAATELGAELQLGERGEVDRFVHGEQLPLGQAFQATHQPRNPVLTVPQMAMGDARPMAGIDPHPGNSRVVPTLGDYNPAPNSP